jgi:hypothetical protein
LLLRINNSKCYLNTSAIVQGTLSASDVIYAPGGNSDQWNLNGGGDLSIIQSSSANWESTYTTVSSNSATWGTGGSVYDDSLLQAASGNWDSTYTTVSANSANWVKYDIEDITTPATWVLDEDNLSSDSDTKVPTQQSVKKYVDDIVTGINNLKGGYNASTDQPAISAGIGVQQGDAYWVETGGLFYTEQVDPGDLIIATEPGANTEAKWVIVNRNIDDQLIDRWNSTYTTTSANSANWDSNYNWTNSQSASWIGGGYDDSLLQAASGDWDSTYTTVSSNSASWGIDTDTIYDDSLLQSASGTWDSTYTTVSTNSASWGIDTVYDDSLLQANSGTWDSTYTTVSSNSAAWGIDTIYDDSLLQSTSGTWDSTYTTVSSNSAAWGSAGSGDFCSTTVLLNEVSACGGTMSVDGLLSASDMTTTTLTADGVYFNTGANRPPELGELVWDGDERTLDLGLDNGVVLQIGEEQIINVKAAENILNGQVVYTSGAVGGASGKIEVSLYSASSAEGVDPGATDELFFVGIATQDIALNGFGYITTFGKVRDVHVEQGGVIDRDIVGPENTDVSSSDPGWDLGTVLYISTSAGRLTNTKPVSPNKIIPTAMIVGVSGNQRTLFVRQEHGYHIDELHDVKVINPQQNDVLAFNSTLSSWDNVTSNNWESTFTTMSANSANWVKYDIEDIATPATWVLDEDTLVSDSAIKVPTQQSVKSYVDGIVTGINSLKGGYDVSTDTPAITAGIGVLQGDSYYVTVSGSFYGQQTADPGDLIIATTDSANLSSEWIVVNRNIQDELIDRWNSTYTTVSTQSASWDSTYTTVSVNSATWDGAVYEVSEPVGIYNKQLALFNDTNEIFKSSKLNWNINALVITGSLDADGLAIGTSGSTFASNINMTNNGINSITTLDMVGTAAISNVSTFNGVDVTAFLTDVTNWNSTYTTVSAQSAAWGIDTVYDDSLLQATSGNWDSTYTTVSANSGIWGGAAALAYNAPTGTYSLEIGLLDGATQTGTDALTIQPGETRASVDNVAEGQGSIAIGKNTRVQGPGGIAIGSGANIVSSNTSQYSIALGNGASCQNNASVAIGYNTVAGLQGIGSNSTVAIGPEVVNRGTQSVAIGSQQGGSYTPGGTGSIGSGAISIGYRTFAGGLNSIAIGEGVRTSIANTAEVGIWDDPGFGVGYDAVRYAGIHIDRNSDNPMTSMSLLSSETAPIDGGAINGAEPAGTLPRKMVNLRRSESNLYLDANDEFGNITTVQVNDDTFLQANSGNWNSTYTTVSTASASWSNSQQTITSSTGTLTLDVSLGQSAITTLAENITTFTIQNASAGDSGVLIISSDGGGWTFPDQNSLGASHIIHTGSSDSISTLTSTTSSAVSIGWYCDGSKQFLYISDPT